MALAPLQVAIPERLALAIPPRLVVEDGTAAGRQIVVMAVAVTVTATVVAVATVATVAVAKTIVALDAGGKILLRLR